jgi:murein DD-endopeptidase MepM/ murein hydrolase activator NlpD
MAAPVAAHLAVKAATSKTVWRIVGFILLAAVLVVSMPFVLVGQAAAVFSNSGSADTDEDTDLSDITVKGDWVSPLGHPEGWSTYPNHAGGAVDFPVSSGTPVYAPAAGVIVDLSEGCGGTVIGVQANAAIVPVVAHLSQVLVAPGTHVKPGQLIALSGASGSCVNGAHLHYEIRTAGTRWGSFTPAYQFMLHHGVDLGPCLGGCGIYPTS